MPDSWHSYPSIFALGHKAIADIFKEHVLVEEKVDGSQISFGVINGDLRMRSKGADINLFSPEKMFAPAVEVVRSIESQLHPEWTYRGEYLRGPHHNALTYDRIPRQHIIIFDINTDHEVYLDPGEKMAEALRLGFETVPVVYEGVVESPEMFREFLETESVLGGQKIEGVVVKNYSRFGPDKHALMGKFVSESFKEVHAKTWREANPGHGDILQSLIGQYGTAARWNKAIQHLTEAGEIEGSPRDIGKILPEVSRDVEKECRDEIADALYAWAWPQIRRGLTHGFPEFYKDKLMRDGFA